MEHKLSVLAHGALTITRIMKSSVADGPLGVVSVAAGAVRWQCFTL